MDKPKPVSSQLKLTIDEIPGPDFTTYVEKIEEQVLSQDDDDNLQDEKKKKYHYSGTVCLKSGAGQQTKTVYGRALACRAYCGNYWSVTIRSEEKNIRDKTQDGEADWVTQISGCVTNGIKDLGYCPRGHPQLDPPKVASPPSSEIFFNDVHTICVKLEELLFKNTGPHPSGLIAITGATDSSKSLITRGLIFLHLQNAAQEALQKGLRKPHLVTFEDPIEQYYVKDPAAMTAPKDLSKLIEMLDALYIDYTPREKGVDAGSLRQVTKDALRQTPSLLFVGETREKAEWEDLLEFAGSNHLVITTSHAGSVVEAMSSIFRAADASTPSRRSEIARRILGIINIRSYTPPTPNQSNIRALLPAMWKRTSQSLNNIVADGLASILPEREPVTSDDEINYYGRTYFAKLLKSQMSAGMNACGEKDKEAALHEISKKATEWDLKGV